MAIILKSSVLCIMTAVFWKAKTLSLQKAATEAMEVNTAVLMPIEMFLLRVKFILIYLIILNTLLLTENPILMTTNAMENTAM